jgi:acetylornithine deacetylase/succinyl-diaminopimelate desuccinylase-like protein
MKHLQDRSFHDVEVKTQLKLEYTRISPNDAIVQAIIKSYRRLGHEPLLHPYLPGSGPFYLFNKSKYLQMPIGLGGFGYTYMHHRVDEFMTVEQYLNNVKFFATVMDEFSATP